MAFRTIEISNPAEIHIKKHQLCIEQDAGVVYIPIEDISHMFCIGPNIRISTMAISILSQHKIVITTLDNKYLPTAIVAPYEGNARQSQIMHAQADMKDIDRRNIWCTIIKSKIHNQSDMLRLLELPGYEKIQLYADNVDCNNVDYHESLAAKDYFSLISPGLNRRTESPLNSRLNYGYAVIRSAIIRSLVATGFHPTLGIHHNNQLNPFNLADDLIEPWRAMVDIVAFGMKSDNTHLNKHERQELATVLQNACIIKNQKMPISNAIDIMCESLRQVYLNKGNAILQLPKIIPTERLNMVSE